MLVLSRKSGECINIGGNIEVKVLDICGGRVRLGFSAPHDVNIQRQEISRSTPDAARLRGCHPIGMSLKPQFAYL